MSACPTSATARTSGVTIGCHPAGRCRALMLVHFLTDGASGGVPVLIAVLVVTRHLPATATGIVALTSALCLACGQVGFGAVADRLRPDILGAGGLIVAGIALAGIAFVDGFVVLSVLAGAFALGVSAFHVDALRVLTVNASSDAGRRLSAFTLFGSLGHAAGPLLLAGSLIVAPPRPALILAVFPLVGALLLTRGRHGRTREVRPPPQRALLRPAQAPAWRRLSIIAGLAAARSGVSAGLQSFVPIYLVVHLHLTAGASGLLLGGMLGGAALGCIVGGAAITRFGPRPVAIGTLLIALGALTSTVLSRHEVVPGELVAAAVGLEACFTATIMLAQDCLPDRRAAATGLTLGTGTVIGGATAAALALLMTRAGAEAPLYALSGIAAVGVALAYASRATGAARTARPA